MQSISLEGVQERRYFTGVQGVQGQEGELFGISNLLKQSMNTDSIIRRTMTLEEAFEQAQLTIESTEDESEVDKDPSKIAAEEEKAVATLELGSPISSLNSAMDEDEDEDEEGDGEGEGENEEEEEKTQATLPLTASLQPSQSASGGSISSNADCEELSAVFNDLDQDSIRKEIDELNAELSRKPEKRSAKAALQALLDSPDPSGSVSSFSAPSLGKSSTPVLTQSLSSSTSTSSYSDPKSLSDIKKKEEDDKIARLLQQSGVRHTLSNQGLWLYGSNYIWFVNTKFFPCYVALLGESTFEKKTSEDAQQQLRFGVC